MKAVDLHVQGKVQGVFYRASTAKVAERLQLAGWVKNEVDGSVRIHAQGSDIAVDQLIKWAWEGPEYASVVNVKVRESNLENCLSFKVLY